VCACTPPRQTENVYGRVESATGSGIPTAVVLYRLALDTSCVMDDLAPAGEIDVGVEGRFHDAIYGDFTTQPQCLQLRAFDPAAGKADTVTILTFVDFANPDSTGVVLRLP
jgi:hypothetical protein